MTIYSGGRNDSLNVLLAAVTVDLHPGVIIPIVEFIVDGAALRKLGVRLAVRFGSQAAGTAGPASDIDVGVFLGEEAPGLMDSHRDSISQALGAEGNIDLVFLDEADPLLLHEVAISGKPLFEATEGEFEEFRVRAVKRYFDAAWIRKIESEALRRRFA